MEKIVLLDRDGVINFDSMAYIKSPDEWQPIPGSIEAVARLTQHGFKVGVASNQSGIARGLYCEDILFAIHQKMHDLVSAAGGRIDKIVYCPHMPEAGCDCRKPGSKMLEELAEHFNVATVNLPFIGDRLTDIQAARACGARPILIQSQMTKKIPAEHLIGVAQYDCLADAVEPLVARA